MLMLTLDGTAVASDPAAHRGRADALRIAGLALLSIRFIQGYIYWGGGSRRFQTTPSLQVSVTLPLPTLAARPVGAGGADTTLPDGMTNRVMLWEGTVVERALLATVTLPT